jgi:hypothetical protein
VGSVGSGWGSVAGCCQCGDETSGSGATDLVRYNCFKCFGLTVCIVELYTETAVV